MQTRKPLIQNSYRRPTENNERPAHHSQPPPNNQQRSTYPYRSSSTAAPTRPAHERQTRDFFQCEQPEIKITNDMQITDGKHRGRQLQSTASPKVRPTARRIRELLFQTLGKRIKFARFLDLCAGSGAVGVEAISRGAALCTFVERSAKMCHFIKLNLDACKVCPTGHGEICEIEVVPYLKRMAARRRVWDLIYFDPPYQTDYDEVLKFFQTGACVRKAGGVLVIEHPAEMFFPPTLGVLVRRKVVSEAETALTFYERP